MTCGVVPGFGDADERHEPFGTVDGPAAGVVADVPLWIWVRDPADVGEEIWCVRRVELAGGVRSAILRASCDNSLDVHINGTLVAASNDWQRPVELDVAQYLVPGTNTIELWGRNREGPGGLWCELTITPAAGEPRVVRSDTSWDVSLTRDGPRRAAVVLGGLGCAPWGEPGSPVIGRPPRVPDVADLELAPGFSAELVYTVPRHQGSWVSCAFDQGGRLVASDQYGGLYRLTPSALGSGAEGTVAQPLSVSLGEAHGLLFVGDVLYAVTSEGGDYESGLSRARDTDGDGELDEVELLAELAGSGEHGPHSVVLGPDGSSLYVIAGNHTQLPPFTASRLPTIWAEDDLLPRSEDPSGHATGKRAPGGWIARADLDGKHWELFAAGLRNAYDLAFNDRGELFTYDSDMEYDVGLPWYRPPRVLHVVSGADFGWRSGSGKWAEDVPDSVPGVLSTDLASPTGIVFGTQTSFPEPWRSALFIADWAYGTIHAVHLLPDGASFLGQSELLASGKPMPVTDLAVGPDGALYFTTGGRGAQSAVYRIVSDTRGVVRSVAKQGLRQVPREAAPRPGSAAHARAVRHRLEQLHARAANDEAADAAIETAWPGLGDDDAVVRHAARTVLEHQDPARWGGRALTEEQPRAAATALLALVRAGPQAWQPALRLRLGRSLDQHLPRALRFDLLRVLELSFARHGRPVGAEAAVWIERLADRFPSDDDGIDGSTIRLLVFLEAADALPLIATRAWHTRSQAQQILIAHALAVYAGPWSEGDAERVLSWLAHVSPDWSGGASVEDYVQWMIDDVRAHADPRGRFWPEDETSLPGHSDGRPVVPSVSGPSWSSHELFGSLDAVATGRNFDRGQAAYAAARCSDCHRFVGQGGSQGPDLSGSGSRFNAHDLLVSILYPSKVVSDQYQATRVFTTDGDVVVGRLVDEDETHLTLVLPLADVPRLRVALVDVVERLPSEISSMPEGLVDGLSEEQVLDLLAYLLAGGDPEAGAFASP